MSIFRKKQEVTLVVGKDLHVYLIINGDAIDKSSVTTPSGARFEGNRIVRITEESKTNLASGEYRFEVVINGKEQSFTRVFEGPVIRVRDLVPMWNRYEGISAFYVLSEVKYEMENHGDMPFFFLGKSFKLPTGRIDVPEFFVLPKEGKKITCSASECDRIAMKETEDYEETLKRVGRMLEEMGRARLGLATSAL